MSEILLHRKPRHPAKETVLALLPALVKTKLPPPRKARAISTLRWQPGVRFEATASSHALNKIMTVQNMCSLCFEVLQIIE